jgi:V/A-type H+-transporting ATPase subunit I
MLKPKEMNRIIVVGPKERMEGTINSLHSLEVMHILDFNQPDTDFKLGKPLTKSSEISEDLVKLRSLSSTLHLEDEAPEEGEEKIEGDLREKIRSLETSIGEEDRCRSELEEYLKVTKSRLDTLRPFAGLGLDFEVYRGYRNLDVFVGQVGKRLDDIDTVTRDYELVTHENTIALFVPVAQSAKVESYLSDKNFMALDVPDESGSPEALVKALEKQAAEADKQCEVYREKLAALRKKHAYFIIEAEKSLSVEIEKAEAPLRFATTEHSFVIDGWVPKDKLDDVTKALDEIGELHVEVVEPETDEPPVELNNPRPSKPYEMLIHLFSTPSYKEIDPTIVLFLIFPIFFGFMIGDAGYGIIMISLGYLLWKKATSMPMLRQLGAVFLWGGIFALIFGLFLFGELFAIPFHHVEGELADVGNWSAYLGVDIPIHAPIHKLHDIVDLLLISVVGALVHLGVGYSFGIANEIKHDKKHALAKAGWLIILFALFIQLMLIAQGTRVGGFFMNDVFYFVPWYTVEFSGITISLITVVLIIVGIVMFVPAEGGMAVLEIIGLAANVLSYTRLAGIAVAKGAVALAFNVMLVPLLLSGNIAFIIMGAVFLFLAHALILILGSLAAGIQALRLNYVEFFLKFYKGSGSRFRPFGKPKEAAT